MNSIILIKVFKYEGFWVFDDESVGLNKEPFVAGADTLFDIISEGKDEVVVAFSDNKFPDYTLTLELIKTTPEGSDYYCPEHKHTLWLCPALFKYFPEAPKVIFLKHKILPEG